MTYSQGGDTVAHQRQQCKPHHWPTVSACHHLGNILLRESVADDDFHLLALLVGRELGGVTHERRDLMARVERDAKEHRSGRAGRAKSCDLHALANLVNEKAERAARLRPARLCRCFADRQMIGIISAKATPRPLWPCSLLQSCKGE